MRIDQPDPAEGGDDANMARRDQALPDEPDFAGKERGTVGAGYGARDSYPTRPEPAVRMKQAAEYKARVDAVHQQRATDHDHDRQETPEQKTPVSAMRGVEGKEPERRLISLDNRPKGEGLLTLAANLKKGDTRQAFDGTPAVALGRSVPGDHGGRIRNLTTPGDRGGETDVPRAQVFAHGRDLPEGYRSSPALRGDPYHPDSVAKRSTANQELYALTPRDRVAALGYTTRIAPQKAPFDSHRQEVFTNGKNYITPDVDGHNVTNGWKMFNRRGLRIGTYDFELNYIKE